MDRIWSGEDSDGDVAAPEPRPSAAALLRPLAAGRSPITFYDLARERRQWWLLLGLLLVFALCLRLFWGDGALRHPPGVLAAAAPQQTPVVNAGSWKVGERVVVPFARFSLKARVLGKEIYRFDAVADLAPVDLALGWGPMSDQSILDRLEIAQGHRRYVVVPVDGALPAPMGVLMASSANMHMIPASDEIEDSLRALRRGEVIQLRGFLVGVREAGQWTWKSSLSRTDVGDGACEVVWVEELVKQETDDR
jgi:hypothetical protein